MMAEPNISKFCTLSSDDQPQRLRDWQALNNRALLRRECTTGGVRLWYAHSIAVEAQLRGLANAETQCCGVAGFSFDIKAGGDGEIVLTIEAPAAVLETPEAEMMLNFFQSMAPPSGGQPT